MGAWVTAVVPFPATGSAVDGPGVRLSVIVTLLEALVDSAVGASVVALVAHEQ